MAPTTAVNGTSATKAPAESLPTELGQIGLKERKGVIAEEWLAQLRGDRGRKVLRQMADNDPIIGASLHALAQLCRGAEWTTRPPDGGSDDDEDVIFAEGCRHDMSHSWESFLGEVLVGMPVFGWQLHEVVYKRCAGEVPDRPGESSRYSDGLIRWRKMPVRSQDTLSHWEFDDEGGLAGMWQRQDDGRLVLIPIEKAALFRTTTARGNPEGRTALRSAYRPWWLKTRVEEQEAIGIERDLTGIPHFEVPPELLVSSPSPEMLAARMAFEETGKNLRRDEQTCVMTPLAYDENGKERYRFSLLGSPGGHPIDTAPIITRHNQTMAMTLLADVILLGHEKVGTQALAVSKVDLLAASLDAWLDGIAEVFNRHLLPRLFSLNGKPTGELPTYEHRSVKPDDVAATVEQIARLAQAGTPLFPDEGLEDWLAEQVGYPTPDREAISLPVVPPPDEAMDDEDGLEAP